MMEWRPLADQDGAFAQHDLGFLYANDEGVPQEWVREGSGGQIWGNSRISDRTTDN